MQDSTQYPHLFDRRRFSHPWLESLNNLQNDSYPENIALAHNWRMDHRVSDEREQTLGITMPLDAALPAVKEIIHAPLKGDTSSAACTGRLGYLAQELVSDDNPHNTQWLATCRENHAARLNAHYAAKPTTQNWLDRHGL